MAHYPEHGFILSSERWRQRTCGQVRRRAPHKNRSQGLQERQEVGLRPPSLGARCLDAGRLPERLHGVALHLQVGRDVSTCCGHAGVALQFGHFEKVTPGKIQDFSLGEIFCWSRNFVRCNDFRKWSHYMFRAAR